MNTPDTIESRLQAAGERGHGYAVGGGLVTILLVLILLAILL